MEYLKDKHCYSAVNSIWTGTAANNPFTGIMNGMKWTVSQLNDFMGEWAMHKYGYNVIRLYPESGATVSGSARIEDHAIVARGTVSGGTVGALSVLGFGNNTFNVSSGTVKTTFYPLGFFAGGQSVAGG